ncbi:MAG: putative Ig domain-containing protein, partial [Verrucomicrobia bacterium]|nr:putative Ig domain-containing protein [Verrucomicrobiota bacterium]
MGTMWPNPRQLLLGISILAGAGVRLAAQTLVWQIGVDDNLHTEFSAQNEKNDAPPGLVTTSAGTPAADDDFYVAGDYPAGFNGLTTPRTVTSDEAFAGWERGHTEKDRTNRVHFVLTAGQVGPGPGFRLHVEFSSGGFALNAVPQSGFGNHDMVIRFRNGLGVATELYAQRIAQRTNLVFEFPATAVNATAGANTVEIVRAGPNVSGTTSYIRYDFLRLEAVPSNTAPVLANPGDPIVDELSLLSLNLQASDAELPAQTLSYSLLGGPDGLAVSPTGVVNWIPTEAQGPGVYPVTVQVTDNGTPPLSDAETFQVTVREVADPPARSLWPIGLDDNQYSEFSSQNEKNDPAPGQVTTSAGTPAVDDDFYFAGVYPAGFNGLATPRTVAEDEATVGWERGHTDRDRTNRVHWVLAASQVGSGQVLRLTLDFGTGGSSAGGGFSVHDMVVRLRNGSGAVTSLLAFRATQPTNVVLELSAAAAGATAGPNTLEIERTGPITSGTSYWIRYDHLRIESLAPGNTPPSLAFVEDPSVDEGRPLAVQLAASDADLPAQTLTFSRISGPEGLTVSAAGLVEWTPTEADGPASHPVEVQVTDNGTPPLSATRQFQVVVRETNAPPTLATVPGQTIPELAPWFLNLDAGDTDLPANGLAFLILQGPPGMTVTSAGRLEWTPGESDGPGLHPVSVQVTDNGTPPLSSTVQFVLDVQEVNQPPVLAGVADQTASVDAPLALSLSATDPDLPAGALGFRLESGPPGLQVSSAGLVSWTPSPAQDDTTNEVVVAVADWGIPALSTTNRFSVVVPKAAPRSFWTIGVQNDPLMLPYLPAAEFGEPDGVDGAGPGLVTRRPGDPGYDGVSNPPADDDFYFRGLYPAGFHGLTAPLDVFSDEPAEAWERRLTTSDPANRFHLVLTEAHLAPRTFLTLSLGFPAGGLSEAGVPQPGFGTHDLEVWFRNGTGVSARVRALRLESPTNLTVDFSTAAAGATAGANTLEIRRTGPTGVGVDGWLEFDFVTLTAETRENQPPSLEPVADLSVAELDPVALALTATDDETPVEELQFSLVSGPAGLSVNSSGDLEWTPDESDGPGTYAVTVRVSDGAVPPLDATTTFDIEVREANEPPVLAEVPDTVVDEFQPLTLMLQASDADLPTNGLAFSRISGPPQLEVSAGGELTWTPGEADGPGIYEVTVQVTDDGTPPLSAVATFAIEVREVNEAPALPEIPAQSTDELSTLQFTLPAVDADTPTNHLTYSLLTGPAGLTLGPAGDVSWTPTEADGPGTFEVTVQVTDDGVPPLSATAGFTIEVHEVNSAPTLTPVPTQEASPGLPWSLALLASDPDSPANNLTFSLVAGPPGLDVAPDGTAAWTPEASDALGAFEVTVRVSDDGIPPLSATTSFTIEVRAGNPAPTLDLIPPQVADELETLTLTVTATDSETPPEQLTYSVVTGPEGLTLSAAGELQWAPTEADGPGSFAVTVRVTDNGSPASSATAAFFIEVREVNAAPALTPIPPQITDELAPLVLTLAASDPDAPTNVLNFALVSGPAGLEVNPAGELTWTPGESDGPGTQEVTVQVTDNGIPPQSATLAFTVEVRERNEPPTLAAIASQGTDELAPLTLTLAGLDSDLPANTLTYALVEGPQGLIVSPAGELHWVPAEADGPGVHEVTVQVTDDGVPPLSVTNIVVIEVLETNAPPALAEILAPQIGEGTSLELTLSGSDDDLPPQSLTYSLVDGPALLTVTPGGQVVWTPGEDQGPSTNLVSVRVEDSGNPALSATREFTVVVAEVNSAPLLDAVPDQNVGPEASWSLQLTATDADLPANILSFVLEDGPSGLTVGTDGLAIWQPTAAQRPSTNRVTVRVADDGTPSLDDTLTFTVVALRANTPPTLNPVADVTIPESAPWSLQLSGSDEDQAPGTLVFSRNHGPAGLSVSPTGTILWTPSEADGPASHPVSIVLSDTGTPPLSVTNEFTVTVQEINQAPVLPTLTTRYVGLGSSLVFHWTATDADLPANALTHRRVSGPDGLKVNRAGLVTWTPVASQAPSTNIVQVAVSDDGTPGLSTTNAFTVICTIPTRSIWELGTNNNPAVLPYLPQGEFSVENGKNDSAPGKVTRVPGDPEYVAATNPTAEDDFYFSGFYPAGFNGLLTPLSVPNDEPSAAWERALTSGDRTNRMHLMLGAGEVFPTSTLQLSFELLGGGSSVGGVVQSGFSEHIVSVVFRNPLGLATLVFSNRLTAGTNVVLTLSNAVLGASEGPNTIEFVRTGPGVSGTTFWIQFDYVRLQLDQGQQPIGDAGSIPASWAADNYLNPANPADLASDRDLDGLTALQEFNRGAQSTDPYKSDTDEDGLSDSVERAHGSNPLLADTDGDGLSDLEELTGEPPSSPLAVDSDGDGASDLHERRAGTDPELPSSVPAVFRGGIALNFVSSSDPGGFLGAHAVAGRIPQTVWNQTQAIPSSGRPSGGMSDIVSPVPGQIVRSDGQVLPAVGVVWTSDSTTTTGNLGSGDQVLMNGLLQASASVPVTLTVSNVPFARYDAYVYVGGTWDGYHGRLRLGTDPSTDRWFSSFSTAPQAALVEIPPGTNPTRGNLVRYSGLTSPHFTLNLTNGASASSLVTLGIHALQIVDAELDGDLSGIPDWWELRHGLDPASRPPTLTDTDGDGLSSLEEHLRGSDPRIADTDLDGIPDGQETAANALRHDSDGDGLSDRLEQTTVLTSNPNLADTDGDGVGDGVEQRYRSDPNFVEASGAGFIGWTPRYLASPARWDWNLENVQLVWDHGSGEMDLDQNNEDQLLTFAVRNASSSDSRTLEVSLRYYRGVLTYSLSSTTSGGFSAAGAAGSRLSDNPTGGQVTDLTRLLGFSGYGPADISDRLAFRLAALRGSGNSWSVSFEIWNQTRNQLLVSRWFDNCTAAASVDNGTAAWSDPDG